jgi:hypothetical protein
MSALSLTLIAAALTVSTEIGAGPSKAASAARNSGLDDANRDGAAPGCGVATVHRLRRGLIPGIAPLPSSQHGRKFIFRKLSMAKWQDNNEKKGLGVVLQLAQIPEFVAEARERHV